MEMNEDDLKKSNEWIEKALSDYKEKIDQQKSHELVLSSYMVTKPWGHEIWLELNEFYAYKVIHMKEGFQSSLQMHEMKVEANYVVDGEAEVLLEDDSGNLKSFIFKKGSGWVVPRGKKHRVIAKTTYTAVEVSTPHLDDVIRFKDDANRGSGKIDEEHKKWWLNDVVRFENESTNEQKNDS